MQEWRRRAYLEAMGVSLWEPRDSEAKGGEAAAERPSVPELAMASTQTEPVAPDPSASRKAKVPAAGAPQPAVARDERPPLDDLLDSDPTTGDWVMERHDVGAVDLVPPSAVAPQPAQDVSNEVAQMDWAALARAVVECRACGLCETRTQTVFGVGDRQAELMIVGEAPGADEDRLGEPFVGRAGQLLTRMLAAIGLAREQVYIANVLKCRPPGNRNPTSEEALQCEPFLLRQMALIQPKLILSVGSVSAQHLLRTDTSVGRLRGRWLDFGEPGIPLRVTYHPAYLLRSPAQKAKAWEDLTEVRRRLDALRARR
ncbi:uracil-DNA glycosylase [Thiorhodococcus mannitoliphagus]|uniref:Type-4 uracil-DNA glycosylase n=1 Tax=Thiorhodococcus mannitoliphagus TaxID=329406 RepID=A0A6P1DKU1_9GAMM|nr:uracil-DNA glycosylase [Thiorhodococcus mannitoliphagus]NEX18847.1 uracil-DNA glycosylase [Thiorhodococcus mannitoliphagus]